MIFLINNRVNMPKIILKFLTRINTKFRFSQNRQSGVTLLLAILVLAAILAISLSLATITFVEIRSSGDLTRTETSFYAAIGVTEQALYKVKRKVNVTGSQCDASMPNCYSPSVGTVSISGNGAPAPFESSINDPVQQDSFAAHSTMPDGHNFPSVAKHYIFYDLNNPSGPSGYSRVKVTYLSSGNEEPLTIYLCQFNPSFTVGLSGPNNYSTPPCSDPLDPSYWITQSGGYQLTPNSSPFDSQNVGMDSTKQQEMIIFNANNSPDSRPIYVQIEAYDALGAAKGIPYFQEKAVDINTQNASVGRKLRVIIPTN